MSNSELCNCGSGRKFKNCCINRSIKERNLSIGHKFDFTGVDGYQVIINNDGMHLVDRNGEEIPKLESEFIATYDRDNGKQKVLFSIPNKSINDFEQIEKEFYNYDLLVAVDTNTKYINGVRYSMTAILTGLQVIFENGDKGFSFNLDIIEFDSGKIDKPENYAWACTIENIKRHEKKVNHQVKIAVIVDSDLGNLEEYNNRNIPIIDEYFLPERVTLMYASADSGQEYLPNKLIKECDKAATKYMKELEEEFH